MISTLAIGGSFTVEGFCGISVEGWSGIGNVLISKSKSSFQGSDNAPVANVDGVNISCNIGLSVSPHSVIPIDATDGLSGLDCL